VVSSGCSKGSLTPGLGPTAVLHPSGAWPVVEVGCDSVIWCGDERTVSTVGKRGKRGNIKDVLYDGTMRGSGTRPGIHFTLIEERELKPY
jgi:hypothetical protein